MLDGGLSVQGSGTGAPLPLWGNTQEGKEVRMSWSGFLGAREQARSWALEAADRLSQGKVEGALPGWRLDAPEEMTAGQLLLRRPPAPAPTLLYAALAPRAGLPNLARDPSEPFLHREALERASTRALEDTPLHRLAWGLERLHFLAARVEDRERRRWAVAEHPADPARDAETAGLWAAWLSGNPWSLRRPWEKLFLPEATRVFRAIAADRKLAPEIARRVIDDLREAFFYRMIGGKGALPGWAELAARVLETAPPGPLESVLRSLPAADRARLGACAAGRGVWRASAAAQWRAPGEATRAALAADALARHPERVEGWMDAHVIRRLILAWASGRAETDWILVTQNRGRARARARALLAARGAKLAEPLLALDGLFSRTAGALRRLCWGWAYSELARDFAFDLGRPLSARCDAPAADRPAPLDDRAQRALGAWLLLVVLKGRLGHLQRWVADGRTGDRDSTWGRLLSDELPPCLRDTADEVHYLRLRGALSGGLPAALRALSEPLAAVVALPAGRGLRAAFEARFRPSWPEDLPFPRAGFPTFQRHAAAALATLEAA